MANSTIKIMVPFVRELYDYHDKNDLELVLRELAKDNRIKSKEIGFCNGRYIAIFYKECLPDKKVTEKLLHEQLRLSLSDIKH